MDWRETISDFSGLMADLVEEHRVSKNSIVRHIGRDKATVNRWLDGTAPSEASVVANMVRFALQKGVNIDQYQTFKSIYDFSPMLSYEEKIQRPLPDLSWLTDIQPPPPARTSFCGLELPSPLGVSSSPLLGDDKWTGLMLDLGFGLSTFKTRRNGPKRSWDAPQIAYVLEPPDLMKYDPADPPEVQVTFNKSEANSLIPNLVNSIGVPSEGLAEWREVYERIRRHDLGSLIGISVMGDGQTIVEVLTDFEFAVEKAKDLRPPFIELNISCPNLEKGGDICDDPSLVKELCERVGKILKGTSILLFIKLPILQYEVMRETLKLAGPFIDGVVYRNTIRVRPITLNREGKPHPAFGDRLYGGLSGHCTFEVTRRGVNELIEIRANLGLEFGIIAVGGVTTPSEVIELLNAGANVVQACTAPMFDPLLAWKLRFHISQSEAAIQKKYAPLLSAEEAILLFPRNQFEIESFNNLNKAVDEIQRRLPDIRIPYSVVRQKWNSWIQQRSVSLVGKAHRITPPRSKSEWIREFSYEKKN